MPPKEYDELADGAIIKVTNPWLHNFDRELEVAEHDPDQGGVSVKEARGASKFYFYSDFDLVKPAKAINQ